MGATVAALAARGCSVVDGIRGLGRRARRSRVTPQSPPPGSEALSRFYSQRLDWTDCEGAQCATLEVPVDYANPQGDTLELALVKVPARKESKRLGSLVVNPGGPGGSGVDYARAADFIVGKGVRDAYDVVGFDPRGVGRSSPDRLPHRHASSTPSSAPTPRPTTPPRSRPSHRPHEGFAQACAPTAGPLLAHVSTADAARDMDVLRAALGEQKLTYLGKSYGTYLGTVYAGLFPHERRPDGARRRRRPRPHPARSSTSARPRASSWPPGVGGLLRRQGDCPLGDSVDAR